MRTPRLLFACALGAPALAQTTFPELEPNDTKPAANALVCLAPGDVITGSSTGTNTVTPGAASADYFDVSTCAQGAGLARFRLTLTSATPGQVGTIRGLAQIAGVPTPGTDNVLQTSGNTTNPPYLVQWYGASTSSSRIVYRVAGNATTTADYAATLSSSSVTPVVVPTAFTPGLITVSTIGTTTSDTEIYLYDAAFAPVPTAHNDDAGGTIQSRVARVLAPGTYYAAISNYNTANSNGDANVDENYTGGAVLDFPNALSNSNVLANVTCDCTISDGVITTPVTLVKAGAFDVAWACFIVTAPTPVFAAFCAGDGLLADHTTPCPCANDGAAGNGCANSVNANGASLAATGAAAADDVVLHGAGMPAVVSCIYLQGDALADVVFGDGVRCAGGTLLRLRTRANVAGASAFPDSTDTVTLSARGGVTVGSGARRYYQTYYRNAAAAFCPPETFNATNGWTIDW
ncbi:MAG: hypothetical protein IPJ77_06225 [Planctomycetes bacterium]|nr:hypothetical protein [Planctomycetota bacterium]